MSRVGFACGGYPNEHHIFFFQRRSDNQGRIVLFGSEIYNRNNYLISEVVVRTKLLISEVVVRTKYLNLEVVVRTKLTFTTFNFRNFKKNSDNYFRMK